MADRLAASREQNRPAVGEPAPDIALHDSSGGSWRLSEQRGSTQVLIFHRHIH